MKLTKLFSVTLIYLCYYGVKCCKDASFNNTEMYLQGEGILISTNITGCLTANKQTENITSISVSDGFVPTLFKDAVSNMPDLKDINFVQMKLRYIERGSFANLPSLHTVNLIMNLLSEISEYMFTSLPIRHLFLSRNRIYFIEDKAFVIDSLVYLSLYDNRIETFSPDWFDNSNLEVLLVSKNFVSSIPENAFVNLRKLKVISFQMNRITSIHKNAFKILPDIEMIDLDCNHIKTLDPNLFTLTTGGQNFANLYLSSNSLTYLPQRMLDDLNNLKVFNFHANPWQCPCYSLIKNWTESKNIDTNHIVIKQIFVKVPVCVFSISNPNVCSESVDEELIDQYRPFEYTNCEVIKNYYLLQLS